MRTSFFAELKRRNVYKVAVAYAIVGWLVVQISSTDHNTFIGDVVRFEKHFAMATVCVLFPGATG